MCSSVSTLNVLSPDNDLSLTLEPSSDSKSHSDNDSKTMDPESKTFRYHLCAEICKTETNYVNILKDTLLSQELPSVCRTPSPTMCSSVSTLNVLSPDNDLSLTLEPSSDSKSHSDNDTKTMDPESKTFRYHLCAEICKTETNYVNILKDTLLLCKKRSIKRTIERTSSLKGPNNYSLCKKRSIKRTIERTSSLKGPNNYSNLAAIKKNCKKEYKHIETIELSYIKFIQNDDSEEYRNCFAIITYPWGSDRSFPTYPFEVKSPEYNLQTFMSQISQTLCQLLPDVSQENLIRNETNSFKRLDFTYSNTIARTVSRSKYTIQRTKEKINRTFSVRRQVLNPAMSLESLSVPIQSSLPPSSPSSSRRISHIVRDKSLSGLKTFKVLTDEHIVGEGVRQTLGNSCDYK
ncbi:unnamed protein product [Oppiella nova]|uniref:ECT2 PH domain-containing protein n=1 Tax=Oppiella nova TaxID=334625 RepID=A0A7R9LN82_9ACAR|nr:unnamed protein product [Oppiella nova]CAG2165313.1 unnamed protein product [Oppiella nova]